MCEKDIEELKDSIETEKATIAYIKKHGKFIIENFINKTLKESSIHLSKFQNDNKLQKQFKKSLQRHLKWIEKHCNKDNTQLTDYRNNDTNEYKLYCDFYTYSKKYIKKDKTIYKEVKKNLNNYYFYHLKTIYCSA